MAKNYFRAIRVNPRPLRLYPGQGGGGGGGDISGTIGKAMSEIAQRIEGQRQQKAQDAIVNRLMNTRNAPRAGLVTNAAGQGLRINPKTAQAVTTQWGPGLSGRPTAFKLAPGLQNRIATGTPFTGGAEELQTRAAAQKLINEADPVGAAVERARAQVAASRITGLPATGSGSRGGTTRVRGGGQPGAPRATAAPKLTAAQVKDQQAQADLNYQPNSEQNPANYTRAKMQKDFDHVYGEGAFEKIYPSLGHIQTPALAQPGFMGLTTAPAKDVPITADTNGLVQNLKGDLTYYEKGVPKFNIGANDIANKWQRQFNAFRRNAGLEPLNLVPLPGGAQAGWTGKRDANGNPVDDQGKPLPGANAQVGTAKNPAMPKNAFDIASVPDGGWYIDPRDGKLKIMPSQQDKAAQAQSQQREEQQAGLHGGMGVPRAQPVEEPYDAYEDPASQKRIAAAEALRNYDETEDPESQQRIANIETARSYASEPGATTATPRAAPAQADVPDLSYSSSYLDRGTVNPVVPPPDVSPNATGQAAAAAAASPFQTESAQTLPPAPVAKPFDPLNPYSYLGL